MMNLIPDPDTRGAADQKPSDQPNLYQIQVDGLLSACWACWFDGFTLTHQGDHTTLTGWVRDQAALHGHLAKIRDLGLCLISVIRL